MGRGKRMVLMRGKEVLWKGNGLNRKSSVLAGVLVPRCLGGKVHLGNWKSAACRSRLTREGREFKGCLGPVEDGLGYKYWATLRQTSTTMPTWIILVSWEMTGLIFTPSPPQEMSPLCWAGTELVLSPCWVGDSSTILSKLEEFHVGLGCSGSTDTWLRARQKRSSVVNTPPPAPLRVSVKSAGERDG